MKIYRPKYRQKCFQKVQCPDPVLIVLSPGDGQTRLKSLGCWRDTGNRAISGGIRIRNGMGTVANCQAFADTRGWTVFAMQNGNECFTAINAKDTYQKYGKSKKCRSTGLGGPWAHNVYEIVSNQYKTGIKAGRLTIHFKSN